MGRYGRRIKGQVQVMALLAVTIAWAAGDALQMARGQAVATPGAVMDPAGCTVSLRSLVEIEALATAPPGQLQQWLMGTPLPPVGAASPVAGGIAADPATVTAATMAVQELLACLNTGDMTRITALWTDAYLAQAFGGLDREILAQMGTPTAIDRAAWARFVGVDGVQILPDGRVAVTTELNGALSLIIFSKVDGRYLFDGGYQLPNDEPAPTIELWME